MTRIEVAIDAVIVAERATGSRAPVLLFDPEAGLVWTRETCPGRFDWFSMLAWVERCNAEAYLGFTDWRLPNAAELARLRRRFPDIAAPDGAVILTVLPATLPVQDEFRMLRRSSPQDTRSRDAAITTADDRDTPLRSPVQGGRTPDDADAVRSGQTLDHLTGSTACTRVFDRVPLVRSVGMR